MIMLHRFSNIALSIAADGNAFGKPYNLATLVPSSLLRSGTLCAILEGSENTSMHV